MPVRAPFCHDIQTLRLTRPGPEILTRYGFVGGLLVDVRVKDPSAPVVTAAKFHVGAICTPAIACRPTVSTSCPDADQLVVGGVGCVGGVDAGGVDEPPLPQPVKVIAAVTATNRRHAQND